MKNTMDLKIISSSEQILIDHKSLLNWFSDHQRRLPWRYTFETSSKESHNRKTNNIAPDPYRVWVSEVMLQQTTVTAVIPYYNRFMNRFPTLADLAKAPLEDVFEYWAGLGYYSRARNLHKAAIKLFETGFPNKAHQLIHFPGFGPYTSRAVASIAFNDPVGVLDGNVIRVFCRRFGLALPWWQAKEKNQLQKIADQFAEKGQPSVINQALMELGATICTPQSPLCVSCPISENCTARIQKKVNDLPPKRPKKDKEIWLWHPEIIIRNNQVALIKNEIAPFLRGQPLFPGKFHKTSAAPSKFLFKHNITHHEIYVLPSLREKCSSSEWRWVKLKDLTRINPSSLLKKAIHLNESNMS